MTDGEMISLFKEALDDVVPNRRGQWNDVTLDTSIEELSVDSVTFMELVGWVEEKTGKVFPDDQLAKLTNFRDLAALVSA
jgi:acyl carrier protein